MERNVCKEVDADESFDSEEDLNEDYTLLVCVLLTHCNQTTQPLASCRANTLGAVILTSIVANHTLFVYISIIILYVS